MIRGAVYPIELGDAKRGHEQRGRRLGAVVSDGPRVWSTVTIVPTSTSAQEALFRPRLRIAGRETLLLTDQIRTIDTAYVIGDPVAYLDHTDMAQVEYALGLWLALSVDVGF
ncbi:type II toxin-antitoxin system PemK/MazF family toxin [Nocardiopsis dassonvillei]|uniref:type II toxin-antitoxin system PemK/MazF family toxin n=1 Tax=Nocardiopsis dassonvillei TaxID=2014 RepID=UPI000B9D6288|nr:type II toxin-antitoxin system PemK/MazF family toxin [Nocardiopsis dassonvillei]ASU58396.1 growth inhibitor PemK [Nocardiopsis dassonvillei]